MIESNIENDWREWILVGCYKGMKSNSSLLLFEEDWNPCTLVSSFKRHQDILWETVECICTIRVKMFHLFTTKDPSIFLSSFSFMLQFYS